MDIGGVLLLQIGHGGQVAVAIVVVAGAELLLKELNAVEQSEVDIVVILQVDVDGVIGLFCLDGSSGVLPIVAVGVEAHHLGRGGAVGVVKDGYQGKLRVAVVQGRGSCLAPSAQDEDIIGVAADFDRLVQVLGQGVIVFVK